MSFCSIVTTTIVNDRTPQGEDDRPIELVEDESLNNEEAPLDDLDYIHNIWAVMLGYLRFELPRNPR